MHDLDIIKINECLVAKNLLANVIKTNEHSNVATFVRALVHINLYVLVCLHVYIHTYIHLAYSHYVRILVYCFVPLCGMKN